MYSEQDIGGKGIGSITNEKIKKGTLILRESPVLAYSEEWNYGGIRDNHLEVLMKGYKEMSTEDRMEYMKLSNMYCRQDDSLSHTNEGLTHRMNQQMKDLQLLNFTNEEVSKVWQIQRTNGFHNGVFLKMSRFNHSCSPNAGYFWNTDIEKRDLRARRNIKKREEITVSYLSRNDLMRNERQKTLKEDFNFDCCCETCNKTEDEVQAETIKCEEFRKIEKEKKQLKTLQSGGRPPALSEIRREVDCISKMYKIARELKLFNNLNIIKDIVEEGFDAACQGFILGEDLRRKRLAVVPQSVLDEFMKSANNFANVGEHISVMSYGETHSVAVEWKERISNPIKFFKKECYQNLN